MLYVLMREESVYDGFDSSTSDVLVGVFTSKYLADSFIAQNPLRDESVGSCEYSYTYLLYRSVPDAPDTTYYIGDPDPID